MAVSRRGSSVAALALALCGGCSGKHDLAATSVAADAGAPGVPADACARESESPACTPPDPGAALPSCAIPGGTIGSVEAADPSPDVGNGTTAGDDTGAPATLPDSVSLRTDRETFNRRYEFSLDGGKIWFRSRSAVTGINQPWAALPMPDCLSGTVVGINVDDDELIAIREDGAIYGMNNALKSPGMFDWSSRWGAPVWQGSGFQLPPDLLAWAWTVISPQEDVSWTDPAGNHPAVGLGKVSHIWAVREGGRRFTFFDPWLPRDDSYEMCGPDRGRFRAANLSASGSTIAAIDRHGVIYTRHYDFDLAGDDAIFFTYAYDDQTGSSGAAIQLPTYDWVQQPAVPGRITLSLSVHKEGRNMEHRFLRVEGEDDSGATGYWEKDVGVLGKDDFHFVATGRALSRPLIDDSGASCSVPEPTTEDAPYVRNMDRLSELASHPSIAGDDDWAGELVDFNAYCSPATLRIHYGPKESFDLRLHTTDVIRQTERARGLDQTPRGYSGAIEIPEPLLSKLSAQPQKVRDFVHLYLGDRRFTTVQLSAVTSAVTFATPVTWSFAAP